MYQLVDGLPRLEIGNRCEEENDCAKVYFKLFLVFVSRLAYYIVSLFLHFMMGKKGIVERNTPIGSFAC